MRAFHILPAAVMIGVALAGSMDRAEAGGCRPGSSSCTANVPDGAGPIEDAIDGRRIALAETPADEVAVPAQIAAVHEACIRFDISTGKPIALDCAQP